MTGWNYDPKNATMGIPEGNYQARLASVEDTVSKAGKDMRVIAFEVYDTDGASLTIKDYFVAGQNVAVFKMKQLAVALGAGGIFDAGTFDATTHKDATLGVRTIVDGQGFSKIKEYLTPDAAKAVAPRAASPEGDDIPF